MAEILVVDDSELDRAIARELLERTSDYSLRFAENGRDAIKQIEADVPDLVLTDLQMPEMNGLELVEAVRERFPSLPVILMTARGSEEIAFEAVQKGAAAYVPKSSLVQHLGDTVCQILEAAEADRLHPRLMHAMERDECEFRLHNDPELFDALAAHVQEQLRCMHLTDESERLRVGQAIKHALDICHHHGNLEIRIVSEMSDDEFHGLATDRRGKKPWSDRSILFRAAVSRDALAVHIQHEGCGIDVSQLPQRLASGAVDRDWMSGFVMLDAVMDDVAFDPAGTNLKLSKSACTDIADGEFEISSVD